MTDPLDRLLKRASQRPRVAPRDVSLGNSRPPITEGESILRATEKVTLRLDKALMAQMRSLCQDSGTSREDLIEAMFEIAQTDPQLWQSILLSSQAKAASRLAIANRKRALTMAQKFS